MAADMGAQGAPVNGAPDGAGRCMGMSEADVEMLFSEFAALYGSRFADMWRHSDVMRVKALWTSALSGFSMDEVRQGLYACRRLAWPPSLPEFLCLCRPEPDAQAAFCEAQVQVSRRALGQDVWPERALYWAAVAFGFYDLRSMSWQTARTRWMRIWQEKRAIEAELPPVPPVREALPAPGKSLADRETARQRLADLKEMLAKGCKKRTLEGGVGKNE